MFELSSSLSEGNENRIVSQYKIRNGNYLTVEKHERNFESSTGNLRTDTAVYTEPTNSLKENLTMKDNEPGFYRVEKRNGSKFSGLQVVLQMLEAMKGDFNQFEESVNQRFLDLENATDAGASNDRSALEGQRSAGAIESAMHVPHVNQPTGQSKVSPDNLPNNNVTVASPNIKALSTD